MSADHIKGGNVARAKNYKKGVGKYYGRANLGVITLNLPYIAALARELNSKNPIQEFWRQLDHYARLVHKAHKIRIDRMENVKTSVAPILYEHGALARLPKGSTIYDLVHNQYFTISLGYAGLYETVKILSGKNHWEDGKELGLSIMKRLDDYCDEWKVEDDCGYSLYGTPQLIPGVTVR